jgi:hypothetical protein
VWVLLPKTSVDGCSSNLLEQKAVMRVNFGTDANMCMLGFTWNK